MPTNHELTQQKAILIEEEEYFVEQLKNTRKQLHAISAQINTNRKKHKAKKGNANKVKAIQASLR